MAVNIANSTGSANNTTLAAWDVHDVKMISCEYSIGESEKDGKKEKYYALDFNYGNDTGEFRVRLFCPVGDKEGLKRHRSDDDKYETPSNEEDFIFGTMHNISTGNADSQKGTPIERFNMLYPKVDPTLNEASFKSFCESIKKLATATIIDPKVELCLKLIGGKTNYARVQNIVGLSKDGNAYIRNNYVLRADSKIKLGFTAKELAYKDKIEASIRNGANGASSIGDTDDLDTSGAKPIDEINTDDI